MAAGRGPGVVNAHTHLYSGLAPLGMPPPADKPANFVQILQRVWWLLDRALDAESLRASARLYVAEALLAGTTVLIDHHESPNLIEGSLDILADACDELGIRALVCYGATDRNGGLEEGRRGVDECRRFVRANRRPTVIGAVGLHASFTVSDETVRYAAEACAELDALMHVHVAEDGADVVDAKARGYEGPLERLTSLGALPRGSILAHGVHLGPAQVAAAERAGLWFVQNPRSNEGNQVGYAAALAASTHVALGTDGWPARMEDERAALQRLAAAHGDDLDRALARPDGSLALARQLFGASVDEDFVVRDPQGRVLDVVIDGRAVVANGALASASLDEIRTDAERQAPELWRRMAALA